MNQGFPPVYFPDSRVLILGSFPSVKSREDGFYYGNKQNRFWKTLSQIFYSELPRNKAQKIELLKAHKIALWDIVEKCDIKGSKDSDIKGDAYMISAVNELIAAFPCELIICNGKKSYEIFTANFSVNIPVICLPSTSMANVSFDFNKWKNALDFLNEDKNYD